MRNHLCKTILKKSKKVYCGAPHLVHQHSSWENVGTSLEWGIENQPLSWTNYTNKTAYTTKHCNCLLNEACIKTPHIQSDKKFKSFHQICNMVPKIFWMSSLNTSHSDFQLTILNQEKIGVKYPNSIGHSAKYSVIKYSKLRLERTKTMGKNSW